MRRVLRPLSILLLWSGAAAADPGAEYDQRAAQAAIQCLASELATWKVEIGLGRREAEGYDPIQKAVHGAAPIESIDGITLLIEAQSAQSPYLAAAEAVIPADLAGEPFDDDLRQLLLFGWSSCQDAHQLVEQRDMARRRADHETFDRLTCAGHMMSEAERLGDEALATQADQFRDAAVARDRMTEAEADRWIASWRVEQMAVVEHLAEGGLSYDEIREGLSLICARVRG